MAKGASHAGSARYLHEHARSHGGRADPTAASAPSTSIRACCGAHHLRDRRGRGQHGLADRGAAAVPRVGKPEEGNRTVHQFARWRGHLGSVASTTPCSSSARPSPPWCMGQAASMGSLLLAARRNGHARLAAELARSWSTSPPAATRARSTDILIHAKEVEGLKRRLNQIYEKHTGRTTRQSSNALERDHFLAPEEAKDLRPHRPDLRKARRSGRRLSEIGRIKQLQMHRGL